MSSDVASLRHASRDLVRELGFLQSRDAASGLSFSHCHALIEIGSGPPMGQSELSARLRLDKSQTSRTVTELEHAGLVSARVHPTDRRARVLLLTAKGKRKLAVVHDGANARVERALSLLAEGERHLVLRGMQLYAKALERSRRQALYELRPVRAVDREGVAHLIRTVMPEFGADGPGFAIHDAEVDDMPRAYRRPKSGYFVVVRVGDAAVVGGGGWAPLAGADIATCELRKMYFLPEARGLGIGQRLLSMCLEGARKDGYRTMYLETLTSMKEARALYARNGFTKLPGPLGATGHFSCDAYFARDLGQAPTPHDV